MNVSILTAFPNLYEPFLKTSLLGRAASRHDVTFRCANFFDFVGPMERIDAPTFGHDAGMLLRPDVVQNALEAQEQAYGKSLRIFFSPHGKKLTQPLIKKIYIQAQTSSHLMLIAARYEGMDARLEDFYADYIISIGDYVLMGGDIPAMVFMEGFFRLLPGIVGNQQSVEQDSFSQALVDHPSYTTPALWQGIAVPAVIRSGNHQAIKDWQRQSALQRTVYNHFEWLRTHAFSIQDRHDAMSIIPNHYVVLMHDEVKLPDGTIGTSSVTSFDIHDVARSCKTFGIKNYFIVTPVIDQQKIVEKMLSFWQQGPGITYNPKRHQAVAHVCLQPSLTAVRDYIFAKEGSMPLIIGTSANSAQARQAISYYDQSIVWAERKPVLFIFGTAKGLSEQRLAECDYMLGPIAGFSSFNHLSVRAAVAIVLDRWLGINLV